VSALPKDGWPIATASNDTPILKVPPVLGAAVVGLADVVVPNGVVLAVVVVDVLEQAGSNTSNARINVSAKIQNFLFILNSFSIPDLNELVGC